VLETPSVTHLGYGVMKERKELAMSKIVCNITITVDGYVAGPNQTQEKPFGDGPGEDLHR
jgi:hypothetical protein